MGTRAARGRSKPLHFARPGAGGARALLQLALLWPVVRWFCHPLTVTGRRSLPRGPLVLVANHASHADTAVILRALPRRVRKRTRPAAAEDHFWRSQTSGAFVSLLTGAFPFPRRGSAGIERAQALLARGDTVLLFPEGTRSVDGTVAEFHTGVGMLAAAGATVVPVGVAGTRSVLPKGAVRPSPAPVSVVFGEPAVTTGDPAGIAAALRTRVCALHAEAERRRAPAPGPRFARAAALASSRAAVVTMALWAVAEALAWPVIPDFLLLPLVVLAPGRWKLLFAAALAGSVIGGTLSFAAGPTPAGAAVFDNAPLVTERMAETAAADLRSGGAPALLSQPLSGIPYKVFSYQAAEAGIGAGPFVAFSALARGARFLVIALLGALLGRFGRPVWERFGGHFLALYVGAFTVGLVRVVASWS